eukprot:1789254-Rhodomonas_salina.1
MGRNVQISLRTSVQLSENFQRHLAATISEQYACTSARRQFRVACSDEAGERQGNSRSCGQFELEAAV